MPDVFPAQAVPLDVAADAPATWQFPLTAAQVFAAVCRAERVAALFCCPGNYDIIHALVDARIPAFGGRTEAASAHAADAFVRATGEIAICSAHQGAGLTNMIGGIACAHAAKTPLLVVASHVPVAAEDRHDSINEIYQQPLTSGIRKFGKLVTAPGRIYEYAAEAFRQLRGGVPGLVHLDVPQDVAQTRFDSAAQLDCCCERARYRTDAKAYPSPRQLNAAVDLLNAARRPMIVSSNGVFYSRAWAPLKCLAEKADIPVVESGAMKGQFDDSHPLSANAAPGVLRSADVVVLVGQHCVPAAGEFAFDAAARYIRIDPSHEDIGRNVPIDVGIVACEHAALSELADRVRRTRRPSWVAAVQAARAAFDAENATLVAAGRAFDDAVHPAVIAHGLAEFLYGGDRDREEVTVVSGGFGIARYVRRWLRAFRPGQIVNGSYRYAAVGPDVGYAAGVAAAMQLGAGVQAAYRGGPTLCITGDAGFAYTAMELETMVRHRLPVVVVVYNNSASGTWRNAPRTCAALALHLFQENLRYDLLAASLGAYGEQVVTPAQFLPALRRAFAVASAEQRPAVLNCRGKKEFWTSVPGFLDKVEPGCMSYHH
jgi:thiamine pyrophosphate-dependent acetolactate synthase large subunit-like protein